MEVPEIFLLDGRQWLIYSTGGKWWGQNIHTDSRRHILGTFYFVSDGPDTPWRIPEDNLLIGSGQGRATPMWRV